MKCLNLITDMTSTGNSMGKRFETPHCQNKLKLNSGIKLQSILAKKKKKKRWLQYDWTEDNKKEEESQLSCAIEPLGGGKLWFLQTLRKF